MVVVVMVVELPEKEKEKRVFSFYKPHIGIPWKQQIGKEEGERRGKPVARRRV